MNPVKPEIVVLDGGMLNPGDISWEEIEALGDLTVYDWTDEKDVLSRAKDADILLTNKSPITKDILEQCKKLRYIQVLATGYNVVDIEYAEKKNIPVSNVPVYGTDSVAQYVFALILELCHHVGEHSSEVLEGGWGLRNRWCFWNSPLIELKDKTIAIIGFGRIGRRVGEIANAFGLKVLAVDPNEVNAPAYSHFKFVNKETAFRDADIISINCVLTPENEGMVNRELFNVMKSEAFLVNVARGPLVNENDLAEALNSGRISGAAVDVVSEEPIQNDNPLMKAKNCIITPHMAWATVEARKRLMHITAENLKSFIDGKVLNTVNSTS